MTVKTIVLRGAGIRKEAIAAVAITPGELIELNTSGQVIPHTTAVGTAGPKFAVENEVVGLNIDTVYAINDTCLFGVFPPGTEIYAWLLDGEVAVIGSFLDSGDNGVLKVVDTAAATADVARNSVVAIALEAVSPSGADGRIKVELL
jgi:hypothetical protein